MARIEEARNLIEQYRIYVDAIDDDYDVETDGRLALYTRDEIAQRFDGFSEAEKEAVRKVDEVLRTKRSRLEYNVLPSSGEHLSNNWWWFLENYDRAIAM